MEDTDAGLPTSSYHGPVNEFRALLSAWPQARPARDHTHTVHGLLAQISAAPSEAAKEQRQALWHAALQGSITSPGDVTSVRSFTFGLAVLDAIDRRSALAVAAQALGDLHDQDQPVPAQLAQALPTLSRAVRRGAGPPIYPQAFPLDQALSLPHTPDPWVQDGPCNPAVFITIVCCFVTG